MRKILGLLIVLFGLSFTISSLSAATVGTCTYTKNTTTYTFSTAGACTISQNFFVPDGSIFEIANGVTVTIDTNSTFGFKSTTDKLLVRGGGKLIIQSGSKLTSTKVGKDLSVVALVITIVPATDLPSWGNYWGDQVNCPNCNVLNATSYPGYIYAYDNQRDRAQYVFRSIPIAGAWTSIKATFKLKFLYNSGSNPSWNQFSNWQAGFSSGPNGGGNNLIMVGSSHCESTYYCDSTSELHYYAGQPGTAWLDYVQSAPGTIVASHKNSTFEYDIELYYSKALTSNSYIKVCGLGAGNNVCETRNFTLMSGAQIATLTPSANAVTPIRFFLSQGTWGAGPQTWVRNLVFTVE